MRDHRTAAIIRTAAMLLALLAGAAQAADKPAAPLTATLLDGSSFSAAAQRGNVLIVNYWASWCGICQQELPAFASYYRQHHADGLEFLAISVDDPETQSRALKVAKTLPFPVALVSQVQTQGYSQACAPHHGLMSLLSFCSLPHTFVVDRQGILRVDTRDAFDQARLDQLVTPLLQAAP